jgi:hypothetical protein
MDDSINCMEDSLELLGEPVHPLEDRPPCASERPFASRLQTSVPIQPDPLHAELSGLDPQVTFLVSLVAGSGAAAVVLTRAGADPPLCSARRFR